MALGEYANIPPMRSRDHSILFDPAPPLLIMLLAAFALRLFQLGAQSLWYDEAVSVFIAQQPIPDLIAHTAGDIHPPLYYLLLHFWLRLAGSSEFAAAYVSLFFGVLLVALGFRLARDWFGLNAGVLTAFLLAISSFNLWYAQEVRMYTLVACLALLSLFVAAQLSTADWQLRRWQVAMLAAAYVPLITLGLYTHYYFAFLWVFIYLAVSARLVYQWLTARAETRTPLIAWSSPLVVWQMLQLMVLVLFAPWLGTAIRQATEPPVPPWRSFVAWPLAIGETLKALAAGQSIPAETTWPLLLVVLGIYLLGLLAAARLLSGRRLSERNTSSPTTGLRNALFLFGATFAPLVLILIASSSVPLYHVRYMFIFSAAFFVVLALGFEWIGRRALLAMIALLGVYAGGSFYADYLRRFDAAYAKDDYRSAVQFIAERVRPGDAVLINAGYIYPAFLYYFHEPIDWRGRLSDYRGTESSDAIVVAQTGSLDAPKNLGWGSSTSDFYAMDASSTARALDLLLSKHPRLWVLRANDTVNDPRGFIRSYLKANTVQFEELTVKGESFVKAQGFIARQTARSLPNASSDGLLATTPLSITLGQRIALLGWTGAPTATAGSTLKLSLYWQSLTPLDVDYKVSLGLYDAQGRRWAQADGAPVGSLLPSGDWPIGQVLPDAWNLAVPLGTPPGDYRLQVSLYDPLTHKSLSVPGGVEGARAPLGRVQVVRPPASVLLAQTSPTPPWARPVFDDKLALESYQVSPERVRPGELLHAELMWHALAGALDEQVVFFQLLDERGRLWATQESPPVDGRYPTSQWAAGEFVRDARDLLVPPDAPDGRYHVIAGLYRARNRERLSVRNGWWPFGSDSLELATIEVKGRERLMKAPGDIGTPTRARFEDKALLIGYDAPSSVSLVATRTLTVTLYWQALAPMATSYKVFVHLVGANQQIATQRDGEPGDGTLPTTGWLPGEYLSDRYPLELRPDMPPGEYTIYVGLYDPKSTVRLAIFDAENKNVGDRWLLRTVTLR